MQRFKGFPADAITFLQQLSHHNQRDWFQENKDRYESLVRTPALEFIDAMSPELNKISNQFNAIAKKSGGSLMRVYRDTRFSTDKTPYKTNIGIQFRHVLGKDVHAPGFYLHIEPDACFLGAGIWHPESKTLAKIRDFIADNPAAWQKALEHKPFKRAFELAGDALKRPPRGYPADHPLIEDLKRKDFIAIRSFDSKKIEAANFIGFVRKGFADTEPFMRYLCTAVEVNF